MLSHITIALVSSNESDVCAQAKASAMTFKDKATTLTVNIEAQHHTKQ